MNDVVIADQNYMVGQTAAIIKQYSVTRFATIATSIFLLFAFALFFILGRSASSDALDGITSNAKSFKELNWGGDLLKTLLKRNH